MSAIDGGISLLEPEAARFRDQLVGALERIDRARFWYIDDDTCAGACPVCSGTLGVRFHGTAARADLNCQGGCSEREVTAALGRLCSRRDA
jgi:hypothetical protein